MGNTDEVRAERGRGFFFAVLAGALGTIVPWSALGAGLPVPDHVVVVVEENTSYEDIIGSSRAPFFNSLAQAGASLAAMYAETHPSQPNYLYLFSGDRQGASGNERLNGPLSSPNLGAALLAAGRTFGGFAESPGVEYRHHPWTNWLADPPGPNQLPSEVDHPFSEFPSDFDQLPTVSFVSPSDGNNMHSGPMETADAWLASQIGPYAQWAMTHNSLLIITWDEDSFGDNNHIATVFFGPMVRNTVGTSQWNHLNLLRTLEDMYGLTHSGMAAGAAPIDEVFLPVPEPATGRLALVLAALVATGTVRRRAVAAWFLTARR